MERYYNWHETVTGKRLAGKVAKAFKAQGFEARIEQLQDHVGTEMQRPTNRFMILVNNPGTITEVFHYKCNQIYLESIK